MNASRAMRAAASAAGRVVVGKKPRRRLPTLAPITLTTSAAARMKELLARREGVEGIKIGVRTRGCNGMSYTLNYVEPDADDGTAAAKSKFDEVTEVDGIKIFIEPRAMLSVVGTVMDWKEDALSAEFVFNNPNAKSLCGCGESFSV